MRDLQHYIASGTKTGGKLRMVIATQSRSRHVTVVGEAGGP
jgi:hypothetical protein